MKDVMIDIESLGTGNLPAITQIGAIEFDLESGDLGRSFTCQINLKESQRLGFEIDADTLLWWTTQDPEIFRNTLTNTLMPTRALNDFLRWFPNKGRAWANGSMFDLRIMRAAYHRLKIKCPWHYRDELDMRTFRVMMTQLGVSWEDIKVEHLTHKHDARSDATFQAELMCAAWKQMDMLND